MKKIGEPCEVCGRFVDGFKYERCCDGNHCDCHGNVINVCLCSEGCSDSYDMMIELQANHDKHLNNWLKLKAENATLKAEIKEYNSLIELQRKRTVDASRLWQGAHGKSEFPDLGELIEWLMKEAGL